MQNEVNVQETDLTDYDETLEMNLEVVSKDKVM